jgi:hypothetical protein
MVKLELNLPWKPILAWPWGVDYSIDPETFLITKHEESWDIEPWEVRSAKFACFPVLFLILSHSSLHMLRQGVKQIFRKPTTKIKD